MIFRSLDLTNYVKYDIIKIRKLVVYSIFRKKEGMMSMKANLALSGGGLSTIPLIAAAGVLRKVRNLGIVLYSGASIGSIGAAFFAAGIEAEEARDFFVRYGEEFCIAKEGTQRIQKRVDEYLGGMLFRDLKVKCMVSITPLRLNFPHVITQNNAENLTVGEVVSLSCALPVYYLPGKVQLRGKKAFVWDGGLTANPPLSPDVPNIVLSYKHNNYAPWDWLRTMTEKKADYLFKPDLNFGVFIKAEDDVMRAYEAGEIAMKKWLSERNLSLL